MFRLPDQIHWPHSKPGGYHCPHHSMSGRTACAQLQVPTRRSTCQCHSGSGTELLCFSMHTSWWPHGMWLSAAGFRCPVFVCLKAIYLFRALVERNKHVQLVIQLPFLNSCPTLGWFACLLPFTEDSAWSANFWTFRGIMLNEINPCLGVYLWAIWLQITKWNKCY